MTIFGIRNKSTDKILMKRNVFNNEIGNDGWAARQAPKGTMHRDAINYRDVKCENINHACTQRQQNSIKTCIYSQYNTYTFIFYVIKFYTVYGNNQYFHLLVCIVNSEANYLNTRR